jgi:hypothetical protein
VNDNVLGSGDFLLIEELSQKLLEVLGGKLVEDGENLSASTIGASIGSRADPSILAGGRESRRTATSSATTSTGATRSATATTSTASATSTVITEATTATAASAVVTASTAVILAAATTAATTTTTASTGGTTGNHLVDLLDIRGLDNSLWALGELQKEVARVALASVSVVRGPHISGVVLDGLSDDLGEVVNLSNDIILGLGLPVVFCSVSRLSSAVCALQERVGAARQISGRGRGSARRLRSNGALGGGLWLLNGILGEILGESTDVSLKDVANVLLLFGRGKLGRCRNRGVRLSSGGSCWSCACGSRRGSRSLLVLHSGKLLRNARGSRGDGLGRSGLSRGGRGRSRGCVGSQVNLLSGARINDGNDLLLTVESGERGQVRVSRNERRRLRVESTGDESGSVGAVASAGAVSLPSVSVSHSIVIVGAGVSRGIASVLGKVRSLRLKVGVTKDGRSRLGSSGRSNLNTECQPFENKKEKGTLKHD